MSSRPVLDIRRPAPAKPPLSRRDLDVPSRGKSDPPPRARLRKARRQKRRVVLVLCGVLAFLLVGASLFGLRQDAVRVRHIAVSGDGAAQLEPLIAEELAGAYFHIIPRDSIFFVPEGAIRNALLNERPDVGAVSISRVGFNAISVTLLPRVNAYFWCGTDDVTATSTASLRPTSSADCYETDPQGFIFAKTFLASATTSATTTPPFAMERPLTDIRVYAPVNLAVPIGARLLDGNRIPFALQLARALARWNAPVESLVVRGDEADLFLASGTRVTYVLGHEQDAATLAASAFPSLALSDGSIEYVDLRFDGKVYVKKK